jgi:uncharacterized protein involved in exopolysaccharide biosynthesis
MVRAPQRTPTVQELAERVSRLEKQMAEMVKTLAHSDTSTVHEMTELRHALLGGRDELRRAFADTASRELVIRLNNELQDEIRAKHTEVMAQFEKLQK